MIKRYQVFTVDSQGGNPLAVFAGHGMTEQEMRKLASELDSGVIAFLFPPDMQDHDARFRFLTATSEIDFCGHGILGASEVLMNQKGVHTLTVETNNAIVRTLRQPFGVVQFERTSGVDVLDVPLDPVKVAAMLSLPAGALDLNHPFVVGSIGSPKLLVPVRDLASIRAIQPDLAAIRAFSTRFHVNGVYAYTFETVLPDSNLHARSFNPLSGLTEDAATGVAAGALGGILAARGFSSPFVIEQGYSMNAASRIVVEVNADIIRIGGVVTRVDEESEGVGVDLS